MKKVILTVSAFIFSLKLMAQAPEKMSYQAVVRNSSNGLVISAPVGMRISILQGSAAGASVYTETQTVNSNANGLVSLEIGSGTVVSGNFATIDWSADTYFIKTETDPTGGTTYTVTGTSQLMSVPYALHAKSAETVINNDDADADPANEIELPTGGNNGQVLSTDGSGNYSWNDQTVNTLPDGTNVGQTAHWDGTAWVVDNSLTNDGSRVGVGVTTPLAKLDVTGSSVSGDVGVLIRNGNNVNTAAAVQIGLGYGSTDAYQQYITTEHNASSSTGNTINFYTSDGTMNGTFPTNAVLNMSMNGGNVGVGTTNPVSQLSVGSSSGTAVTQTNTALIAGNNIEALGIQGSTVGTNLSFYKEGDATRQAVVQSAVNANGSDMSFYTTSSTGVVDQNRMTINADGNIGIGTTIPSERLDVIGSMKFTGALMPNNTAGTTGQVLTSAGAGTAPTWTTPAASTNIYTANGTLAGNRVVTQGTNTLGFTASAVNAFSVDGTTLSVDASNNRVGIGTAAPTNNFHVATTTLGAGITVSGPTPGYRLSPTAGATIAFGAANIANEWATGSATNDAVIVNQHATGKLILATGSSAAARMTITPTGSVGIGTVTPLSKLDVVGDGGLTNAMIIRNGNDISTNQSTQIAFGYGNSDQYKHYISTRHNAGGTVNNAMEFYTSDGTANGTIATASQCMSLNGGKVGIGTNSPQVKLHVNAVMRLEPQAAAPATAGKGDMYFNGTTNKLMVFDGSVWQACW